MRKKKILLASAAFYPENSPRSFRATELAKEFARQGHAVKVITTDRGEVTQEFCKKHGIELQFLSNRTFKPVRIRKGFFNISSRLLTRLLLLVFEYPDIELMFKYRKALRRESGFDLLISFAVPYPVHWGTAFARAAEHKIASIWVADCGDPYVGDQSDSFKKLFHFHSLEKYTFRKTDYISIPIDLARPAYFEEFQRKIVVIPQGLNFAELTSTKPTYSPNKLITFAYAGSFIPEKRDPRKFLDFLLTQKIDFRFYIFTTMDSLISEYVARSQGRIVVNSYIPRKELINLMSKMSFLINFENSTTTQAPSKLIDYYLAERPVLSVNSHHLNVPAIERFLQGNYEDRIRMEGYDKYRIENVTASFLNLIQ